MRDPQFYASGLNRAAERVEASAAKAESESRMILHNDLLVLARKLRAKAEEWQEVSFTAGRLKGETYTLLSREIEEIPWTVAVVPEVESLYKNMIENDVT